MNTEAKRKANSAYVDSLLAKGYRRKTYLLSPEAQAALHRRAKEASASETAVIHDRLLHYPEAPLSAALMVTDEWLERTRAALVAMAHAHDATADELRQMARDAWREVTDETEHMPLSERERQELTDELNRQVAEALAKRRA